MLQLQHQNTNLLELIQLVEKQMRKCTLVFERGLLKEVRNKMRASVQ